MLRIVLLVAFILPIPISARAQTMKLEGVVNINTASPEELRMIPSIGPARIRNILAYRRAHPFRTVDELARIKGIGRKTVRRWRQHLAVSGPSTAERVLRPEPAFVGPTQASLPAPARMQIPAQAPKPPSPSPLRKPVAPSTKPSARRGEPAHHQLIRAPGNPCLPPP